MVGLETERRAPRHPMHRDKLRKRGTVEVGLDNEVCKSSLQAVGVV